MYEFTYTTQASRVVFGAGSMKLIQQEVETLGARRALVLCTPEQKAQAEVVSALLGPSSAGVFDGAQMHVPIENARRAREHAKAVGADCAVAIGGGSTIGLGKAIALESPLPIIAIPTTYAGSEMTPIYGITEDGLKKTGRDARVIPKTVLYDAELTIGLPVRLSIVSGLNAIAHAAEGLYSKDGNPVMSLMAEEGIRSLANGLRGVNRNSRDRTARSECLYGAWLCGMVLGNVGMALHHKLCHTLGGTFNLPHAETHAIVLPHALAYNSIVADDAMERIARALNVKSAPDGLYRLNHELGVPQGLREIGLSEADLDRACEVAMSNPYWNPRPVEEKPLRALLQRAWEGARPAA
ncbi:alcohol dehydrogenase, iron-dependent [Caballeronia hypogeia]|uniref:maleylacetate reductase n=1 Tax=Caballeronia hypogeia TaxID=1777140 RepID=A0A157ZDN0_9BURK|nr:maleylacetate reductase [Caballeronia hypogeia]SAK43583.1 alcohol dehydrogenase, iron-dependent [Caballeronia hypogeia]